MPLPNKISLSALLSLYKVFDKKKKCQLKTKVNELSPNAYARVAGVLYLVITVAAIFAHFVIPEQLIVPGGVR